MCKVLYHAKLLAWMRLNLEPIVGLDKSMDWVGRSRTTIQREWIKFVLNFACMEPGTLVYMVMFVVCWVWPNL